MRSLMILRRVECTATAAEAVVVVAAEAEVEAEAEAEVEVEAEVAAEAETMTIRQIRITMIRCTKTENGKNWNLLKRMQTLIKNTFLI